MQYSNKFFNALVLVVLLPAFTFAQTLLDIEIGVNNIPITEVEFIYDGDTVIQTAGVTGTNTVAVGPARLVQMKIYDGDSTTILYPNSYGSMIANNNFTPAVTGVGVYEDGNFISAADPALWEPAMLEVVDSNDLMNFLYYDGAGNIPGGDDFDVLFVKGIQADDYIVVGERDGNTYFTVTPLDSTGNPIVSARKLRFGQVNGTNSGNGTSKYDWDIGLSPTNQAAQSMVYSVVSADLFATNDTTVFGFRIDNNGDADVKFYGLSDNDFSDNPSNPIIGGITGNVFNDDNGLTDSTVDGIGIDDPDATQLYAILYDNTNTQIDNFPINTDGSYEFLNLDNGDYNVLISELPGTNGSTVPATQLPTDWIYTGDFQGTGAGNDGTVDGIQTGTTVLDALETEVNFGIEKTPEADDYTYSIANPDLNEFFTIGAGATSDLTGTDNEDGAKGTGDEFGITSLPTNGNEIYYNGTQITLGDDGINPPSAANPFTIASYDPSLLEIKFTNPASTSTAFNYTTTDEAEETSPEATYTLNYTAVEKGSLSGTVFNDADGLTDSTVDGTAFNNPDATQLYATIYESGTATVLASQAIAANGTYLFDDLVPNTNYDVIISTNSGTVGAAIPAIALPTDWMHTGDNEGTGVGNDGTPDGLLAANSVGTTELPNVNFGIQKTPEADDYTFMIANPDLNELFTVGEGATSDLTGTDNEDGAKGTGDEFGITSLPTNGNEIYYNGSQITLGDDGINPPSAANPFTIASYDPSLLEIKFTNPASTSTAFNYTTTDEAEETSPEATYTLNYTAVEKGSLSGTVFNDADGLTDSTVDGTAFNNPDATQLYATIYESGTATVLASQAIAANGTYLFDNLVPNTNYDVLISTNSGTVGAALPAIALPTDWMHTGDNEGTGAGNDGTPDGLLATNSVGTSELPNVNFGIQKTPEADDYTFMIANPDLNELFTVGAGATSDLTGTDNEDGAKGTGDEFGITSLPTNGNEIYYNGTQITLGDDGINPPSAANPFTIASYDPSLLEIKFTNPASTSTAFNYTTTDAADETSPEATYTLNYTAVLKGSLSGTVYNDADGLTDNTVDGTAFNNPDATQLYATIYESGTATVLASQAIAANGTYLFDNLTPNTNYDVIVSTTSGTIGAAIPAIVIPTDWMHTGDNEGTGAGNDGTPDGQIVTNSVGTTELPNVNFGIQKTPEADDYTFMIANPDLNELFTVGAGATSDLTGTDNEDGAKGTGDEFGITSLPTNGNEIYYNGSQITLGDDGINPPSAANPFTIATYDPSLLEIKFTNPASTSTAFNYTTTDAADETSPEATYTLNYTTVLKGSLSGTVYNDADGLTDNTVDGTAFNNPDATQLYATIYESGTATVLASQAIAANGTYLFDDLTPNTNYDVIVSTTSGTIGVAIPAIVIPTDWVHTGDNEGTGAGNDGTPDGQIVTNSVGTSELPNVNFGIQERPETSDFSFGIANPAPNSFFVIGSGATSDLDGTDLEDGSIGSGNSFGIASLPTSGNEIYYNAVQITVGDDGINPPSATNPFSINNYDPSLLEIKFTGGPQSSTSFDYVSFDAADFADLTPATYELSYTSLPVEWAAFTATKNGESAVIYFATSSEKDNNLFFVQKSLDGELFRNIHTIAGQGNSDYLNEYYYVDPVLNLGVNYYRIAQVDFDGTTTYTEVKLVTFNETHTTLVYPNPAPINSEVRVKYYSGEETVFATVTNMLGVVVRRFELNNPGGWNETSIELNNLASGTYALRIGDRQKAVIFNIAE